MGSTGWKACPTSEQTILDYRSLSTAETQTLVVESQGKNIPCASTKVFIRKRADVTGARANQLVNPVLLHRVSDPADASPNRKQRERSSRRQV